MKKFRIWRTISLGVYETAEEYCRAVATTRCIRDWVWAGKPSFTCARQGTEVNLVIPSVGELEFDDQALADRIFARGIDMGLLLCTTEVPFALSIVYNYQPRDERLRIAMKPYNRYENIFGLANDYGEMSLNSYGTHHDSRYNVDTRFAFVLPRK